MVFTQWVRLPNPIIQCSTHNASYSKRQNNLFKVSAHQGSKKAQQSRNDRGLVKEVPNLDCPSKCETHKSEYQARIKDRNFLIIRLMNEQSKRELCAIPGHFVAQTVTLDGHNHHTSIQYPLCAIPLPFVAANDRKLLPGQIEFSTNSWLPERTQEYQD